MTAPIGVIGGGTMGAGIAHVLADRGRRVVLVEATAQASDQAAARVEKSLRAAQDRGKLTRPVTDALSGITFTADIGALGDAGFVIEAVPEDPGLKRGVLRRAEAVAGQNVTIATNTSSLSIATLADGAVNAGRFVGMHFFNPVPASRLIEIVRGPATGADAVAQAAGLAALIGKESVTVRDSPGFATSRLGVLLGLEAIRMVEEGVAEPADIDRAMVLGYRHPMGPLRLTDLVGLDVRLSISDYLAGELGDRFRPPDLLRSMVAEGHLGQKTGQGFYRWE
jgi:3-hydroxybutyryl-CoA dehydrogenase